MVLNIYFLSAVGFYLSRILIALHNTHNYCARLMHECCFWYASSSLAIEFSHVFNFIKIAEGMEFVQTVDGDITGSFQNINKIKWIMFFLYSQTKVNVWFCFHQSKWDKSRMFSMNAVSFLLKRSKHNFDSSSLLYSERLDDCTIFQLYSVLASHKPESTIYLGNLRCNAAE